MSTNDGKHGQIVDAAVAEFLEHGFQCTSMDRIAARASVSKRTVYNHFESKEALFRAILDIMVSEAASALDISYKANQPIRDQLLQLARAEGELMTDPEFMRLARMVMGETVRDPELAAEKEEKIGRLDSIRKFLAAANDAGALRIVDIQRATQQFQGLIKSQAFWPFIFSCDVIAAKEMEAIVQTSVDMFLKEYLPPDKLGA